MTVDESNCLCCSAGQRWSWQLGSSGYSRWALNQPGNVSDCASVFALSKELATYDCSQASLPYLCMRENVVVVKETKTWEEARDRCQALGYQLLSVQPGDDLQKVRGYVLAADTQKVGFCCPAGDVKSACLPGPLTWCASPGVDRPALPGRSLVLVRQGGSV